MAQPIRDIRGDLKARLDLMGARRALAQTRYDDELRAIKDEEGMLEALLAAEERFMASTHVTVEREWAGSPLENEILDIVSDEKNWDHGDIKAALIGRGFGKDDDPKRFGQSLQGTLLSMAHRNLMVSAGHGAWKITKMGLNGFE